MSKQMRLLLVQLIWLGLTITLIYCIFNINLNFKFFEILKITTINEEVERINRLTEEFNSSMTEYTNKKNQLYEAKTEFETQKNKYELISEDSLNMIRDANTEEVYNIEYLWIRLGNYAKESNLEIYIVEPGGSIVKHIEDDEDSTDVEHIEDDDVGESDPNGTILEGDLAERLGNNDDNEYDDDFIEEETSYSGNEQLQLTVTGIYLDVADFVFNVENDDTLQFRLDNINMVKESGNNITASFTINKFKIIKE